ncbi:aspartyl-phosphate phosphatase Spo0E family protein [Paenibacillus jilunlii]|uniref:Uncharacterized protein n=1 Tax=Paenibacillus jilunlii TaxID=682956 RepID=A0A1H0AE06_9BACL|nr:aspartyl-phosphate phosphatase Spo0E family protein [Paenibacillus jilunlii]KWX79910.1 hypothetical protein AML91_01710 [Paenibacillus jilunlii]SDN31223.1 hypothetical protein SAMN05216191_1377 [Paenibacillus jilunlii]
MSSIFNSEAWKKAVGTYKTNQSAQKPMMPAGAIAALPGAMKTPKPPQATGLPPAAIKAANNVRSGVTSVPSVPTAARTAAQTMVSATTQPRTEQALSAQSNLVNTPFTYNADTDPAYQAALRAAQQNLSVNQKNTNAQLRATGQGKSSYSETVANQLANQSAENIANNVLPIYAQQAYQQYQDNIGNQRNLYQDYNQQDFNNPITEAQVTGNYLPAEAKQAIQNLLGLKTQAETKGITKDARAQLSTEADAIRAQLKALGIDPSFYGADKTAAQASANNPGIRTLAGQAQDQSVKNANLDAAMAVSNMTGRVVKPANDYNLLYDRAKNPNAPLTANQQNTQFNQNYQLEQLAYSKARDAIADKQWQAKFDYDKEQGGLDYALRNLSEQNQAAYQQAQLGLSQDDNARAWAQLDYEQSQPGSTKSSGLTPSQVLESVKSMYSEPIYNGTEYDTNGNEVPKDTGKTKVTTDSAKRKEMFETVIDYGLSDAETNQILLSLGMSKKEIDSLLKSYSGN